MKAPLDKSSKEGHGGDERAYPTPSKGKFEPVGNFTSLSQTPNSPNKKTGEGAS